MPTLSVVPRLDIAEDRPTRLLARVPVALHDQLELEHVNAASRTAWVSHPCYLRRHGGSSHVRVVLEVRSNSESR